MVGRVVLFPCGGLKKPEATVVRWATYRVNEELLPRKTLLLCVPAFYRGVPEDLVMVEKNPTRVGVRGITAVNGFFPIRVINA